MDSIIDDQIEQEIALAAAEARSLSGKKEECETESDDVQKKYKEAMEDLAFKSKMEGLFSEMHKLELESSATDSKAKEASEQMETEEEPPAPEECLSVSQKKWLENDIWTDPKRLGDAVAHFYPEYESSGKPLKNMLPVNKLMTSRTFTVKIVISGTLRGFAFENEQKGSVSRSIGDMIDSKMLSEVAVLPIKCRSVGSTEGMKAKRVAKGKEEERPAWDPKKQGTPEIDPASLDFSNVLISTISFNGECSNGFSTKIGVRCNVLTEMNKKITTSEKLREGLQQVVMSKTKNPSCDLQILRENKYNCESVAKSIGVCEAHKLLAGMAMLGNDGKKDGEEGYAPPRVILCDDMAAFYYVKALKRDSTLCPFGKTDDADKMPFMSMYEHDIDDFSYQADLKFLSRRPIIALRDLAFSIEPASTKNGWEDYLPGCSQMRNMDFERKPEDENERAAMWEALCTDEQEIVLQLRIKYYVYHKELNSSANVYCPNPRKLLQEKEKNSRDTLAYYYGDGDEEEKLKKLENEAKEEKKRRLLVEMMCAEYLSNECEWK